MLQRIQSLLLLFAAALNIGTLFVPLWAYGYAGQTETVFGMEIVAQNAGTETGVLSFTENVPHIIFFGLIVVSSLFLLFTIFQYNSRPKQMRFAYIGIGIIALELVALVLLTQGGAYLLETTNDGAVVQFGFAFPIVAILLTWLAAKRIKKDEDLVKSVDRFR